MNIVNNLNILLPKMDSKQKEFVVNYATLFKKIEDRILSPKSYVGFEKSYLVIYIEHVSDPNTWIEFKIERREIYITVVGFGYSMWHVANGKGAEFEKDVKIFIQSALANDFKKVLFYDRNGDLIKEKLIWNNKPELMTISQFGSPSQLIKKWFLSKFKKYEYRTSEVNFSKFV